MRRRDFIKAVVGSAAVWPLTARAQQTDKAWRIGFIAHGHESFYDALFEGLRGYGYEEGRNLIVERRYAQGQAERFKEFAAEMVRLNVDVVVVVTTPAALAVMNASKTIPIVHPNAIDPLNTGLIASLAHPGGNGTGGAQLTRGQRKTPGNPEESGAGAVARGGAVESGQSGDRVCLERNAKCGGRAGNSASIARGARTKGFCVRFCKDRRRAPRRASRFAGRGDDAAAKRDHRFRDKEAVAEHVSGERVGPGGWSDVLRGEPSLHVSSRRILRGQDFQRRKARRSACGTSDEVRPGRQP